MNPVVETYSRLAREYDDPRNIESCWGRVTEYAAGFVTPREGREVVVDVGCGTGRELDRLASISPPGARLIGVEPAANMREIAASRTSRRPNVQILDGSFEALPLEAGSVDYLYSILAFHWTTDPEKSIAELARVLKPTCEMDLVFIGRNNGREFIRRTTPVFFDYLTPKLVLDAASRRKQLTVEQARALFERSFNAADLDVTESYHTYHDTLEGHWGWWVRIEGQFVDMPKDVRTECDKAVKAALSELATEQGIPYTVHLLHVRFKRS